jgi:hypothetical protein
MGTDGLRRVIVNSIGKEVGRLEQQDAIPGKPIQLTIDYDLQAIADSYMADKEGAVVAMDGRKPAKFWRWSAGLLSIPTILRSAFPTRNGNLSIRIPARHC